MSYNLSIMGHKDHPDVEAGKQFEKEIIERARQFVASLEGVTTAHGSFQFHGGQSLLPEATPEATP